MTSTTQNHQILTQILEANGAEAAEGWLDRNAEPTDYPPEFRRLLAKFEFPTGGEAELLNLSQSDDEPTVAVVYRKPHISRGRTPAGNLVSPMELFLSLNREDAAPEILRRHHGRLADRGIFDHRPRDLPAPLWGIPDPDLPPEYGPVDLCQNGWTGFLSGWAWFSMWHGVVNRRAFEVMRTGWSVLTGVSPPRSAALCMAPTGPASPSSARARYVILNKQEDGPWQSIYSSPDWTGPGEGVGFQVYGPDAGQTRIRVTTQDNADFLFFAGASWGTPDEWIAAPT